MSDGLSAHRTFLFSNCTLFAFVQSRNNNNKKKKALRCGITRWNQDSLHRPSAVIWRVLTHRADHSSIVSLFVGRQRTLSSGPFTRYFRPLQFCIRPLTTWRIHHCLSHRVWEPGDSVRTVFITDPDSRQGKCDTPARPLLKLLPSYKHQHRFLFFFWLLFFFKPTWFPPRWGSGASLKW